MRRPLARCFALALAIIGHCAACQRVACGQATQLVKWQIQATVTEVVDPNGIFPDVRLGDPVHGTLQYDAMLWPNPFWSIPPLLHTYTNYPWLYVASMVVENTRNGGALRFTPDEVADDYTGVDILNDVDVEGDLSDGFLATQPVLPPPGFAGEKPVVAVTFAGPATTIPDLSLPAQLSLEDWPAAGILFYDRYFGDESGTTIEAEIYSLTPVAVASGDFNSDGLVDAGDLAIWQEQFGGDFYAYGDADADGDADGGDFLVWQRQLGSTASSVPATAVPEPGALAVVYAAIVGCAACGRASRQPST